MPTSPSQAKRHRPAELLRLLRELEARLTVLDRRIVLADWRLFSGRSPRGALPWQLRRNRLLSQPGLREVVRKAQSELTNPLTVRRFQLLERMVTEAQLEQHPPIARARAKFQRQISSFRPLWKGRRVNRAVVREQVRKNPDRDERRAAYYAEDPLYKPIEREAIGLIRARNARARELGFRSYPEYRLGFEGLTVGQLRELMAKAAGPASGRLRALRDRFLDGTGSRDWYPWDLPYFRDREVGLPDRSFPGGTMVPAVLNGARAWGFRGATLRFRIDRHDLPFGGIEVPVDPPKDVRVIVHPHGGWEYYRILFHEVGHALHARSVTAPTHLLRWHEYLPGFPGFVEGIGTLFEEIPANSAWLRQRSGLARKQVDAFLASRLEEDLVNMVFIIDWVRTELDLYLRPSRDPATEQLKFLRPLFGFDAYEPRSFANSFLFDNPVYLQSYLLAVLFAKQIVEAAIREVGGDLWPNSRIGPWLTRNWLRWGARFDWIPRVREITGHPFGPEAYLRGISASA